MFRASGRCLAGVLMLGVAALTQVSRGENPAAWPPVHVYAPAPELAQLAVARAMPLAGIERTAIPAEPRADDVVVLLVVLDERIRRTQWLVQLRGPERVAVPRSEGRVRETVVYGMDGRAIRFPALRETYRILALGPHHSDRPAEPLAARELEVGMNAAFLGERLDRAAGFMVRAGRARIDGRLRPDEWFTVLPQAPVQPDAAARERFVVEAGLTEADERAVAASVPALGEFARVIAETPGLREVLFAVVDKPSIWSILARFGRIETDFRFRSGEVVSSTEPPPGFAGIGRSHTVPFTFSINGRAALECTMLVVEPRPPLRMCGGIVAIVAEVPDRPDVRLLVRVLAARPGMAEPAGP